MNSGVFVCFQDALDHNIQLMKKTITDDTFLCEIPIEYLDSQNKCFLVEVVAVADLPALFEAFLSDFLLQDVLAEIEHNQWVHWSRGLASQEKISEERLLRWQNLWNTPYALFPDEGKEADRVWVKAVVSKLKEEFKRQVNL